MDAIVWWKFTDGEGKKKFKYGHLIGAVYDDRQKRTIGIVCRKEHGAHGCFLEKEMTALHFGEPPKDHEEVPNDMTE